MFKFKSYLIESYQYRLPHLEDLPIHNGNHGFMMAITHLNDLDNHLKNKNGDLHISTKFDGSPSVVFGVHPKTKKFFVGTKSVFNKNTPKINYSHKDIEKNHDHSPGLVKVLKHSFDTLPKLQPNGVHQGDLMFTQGDLKSDGSKLSFQPNTIKYSVPLDSNAARDMQNAKMGMAIHTSYDDDFNPRPYSGGLRQHPDVHLINTQYNVDNSNYTPEQREEFRKHFHKAFQLGNKVDFDLSKNAKDLLLKSVNDHVRAGTSNQSSNFLKVHHHLGKAKDVLLDAMGASNDFEHSINNERSSPEGFVVHNNGETFKLVNRAEFSRKNFNKNEKL